jgi:hypothetical protein
MRGDTGADPRAMRAAETGLALQTVPQFERMRGRAARTPAPFAICRDQISANSVMAFPAMPTQYAMERMPGIPARYSGR